MEDFTQPAAIAGDPRPAGYYAPPPGPAGEFGVGSVLSGTLALLFGKPVLFFGLAVLASLPGIVASLIAAGSPAGMMGASVIGKISEIVLQGAIAYGVYRSLRNEAVGFGEALIRGLARFFPILGIGILVGFGTGIGMLLLVIPGLILSCLWSVAVPACVTERLGVLASMSRSGELTKGYRWSIFCLIALLAGVNFAFVYAILFGVGAAAPAMIHSPAFPQILGEVAAIIPLAFNNTMLATIYYKLRAVREGISVDRLANVFD